MAPPTLNLLPTPCIGTTEFAEGVWLGVELRKPGELNSDFVY